jgi:hypothetical protein
MRGEKAFTSPVFELHWRQRRAFGEYVLRLTPERLSRGMRLSRVGLILLAIALSGCVSAERQIGQIRFEERPAYLDSWLASGAISQAEHDRLTAQWSHENAWRERSRRETSAAQAALAAQRAIERAAWARLSPAERYYRLQALQESSDRLQAAHDRSWAEYFRMENEVSAQRDRRQMQDTLDSIDRKLDR